MLIDKLQNLIQSYRNRKKRHALQDAAENSDNIEEMFENIEADDRVELTDE